MATIVPAILEFDRAAFLDKESRIVKIPGVRRVQVDFCDGVFVPTVTVPIADIDVLNPSLEWEAHLMVKNPVDFLDYQIAGFRTIILQVEAFKDNASIMEAMNEIRELGMEPGLSINPETPVSVLRAFEPLVRHFQIMSVHPGSQGSPFLEQSVARIAELRKLCPNAILEADGGINETNIKQVADAGADLLIAGSALTKAPTVQEAYENLQQKLISA